MQVRSLGWEDPQEEGMATYSNILAWRIPGMGSLVGCRLWGRTESDTTEATQQQQQQGLELVEVMEFQLSYFKS